MYSRRRQNDLLIEELPDETLVYDVRRHKAHCLNQTAAQVWKMCDGTTSVAQMATHFQMKGDALIEEPVIWSALDQLAKAKLLDKIQENPECEARLSRREIASRFGFAALAAVVTTIAVPVPVAAGTTIRCCESKDDCSPGKNCVGGGHRECNACPSGKCCI